MVKNTAANAGDIRDLGSIPWSGRFPGGGNGNPLQYSCLENPMDRGAWQTSSTRLKESDKTERLTHTHTVILTAGWIGIQNDRGSKRLRGFPKKSSSCIHTCKAHRWPAPGFRTTKQRRAAGWV